MSRPAPRGERRSLNAGYRAPRNLNGGEGPQLRALALSYWAPI